MKRTLLLLISSLFLAAACSRAESRPALTIDVSNPIEVEIKIEPEQIKVDDAATFSVTVKQADEPVDDANEVKFEIWQKGQDDHQFITAENKGSGVYAIVQKFAQAGVYYVMYHVTARDFHSMNKTEFTVAAKK
jgi:methionine-rich copper-binding protein CopC